MKKVSSKTKQGKTERGRRRRRQKKAEKAAETGRTRQQKRQGTVLPSDVTVPVIAESEEVPYCVRVKEVHPIRTLRLVSGQTVEGKQLRANSYIPIRVVQHCLHKGEEGEEAGWGHSAAAPYARQHQFSRPDEATGVVERLPSSSSFPTFFVRRRRRGGGG